MRILPFIAFSALLTLVCIPAMGQRDIPKNLPDFDAKRLHFGFQLGVSQNGFAVTPDFSAVDSLVRLDYRSQPGFVIRVVSELHLGKYFGLRHTPGIAFAARDLNYYYTTSSGPSETPVVRTIESTFIDIPLYFKYRSARVNNFAQYVFVGFNYAIDLASQQYVDNQIDERGNFIVKLKRNNYMAEVGFGFDFFMEYFKFSPEFRFSYGVNNIIVKDNTVYARPIDELHSRIFSIALNFEG